MPPPLARHAASLAVALNRRFTALAAGALPTQCEICRHVGAARLCAACVAQFEQAGARCERCAIRLPAGASGCCGGCGREPPAQRRTVVAVDYVFPWDTLVLRLKFNGQTELAAPLAERLMQALRAQPQALADIGCVLPVPLAHARLAQRGYNQAWEIARTVARGLGLAADAHALLRPLDGAHQAGSSRAQRALNLRGAFMVAPAARARLQGLHLALVDDVVTTGATAHEAVHTLLRAGAASVSVWAVARTA